MSKKVGPGNPPRKNRFQKGKSGNPRGRPKKSGEAPYSPLGAILDEKLVVKVGGVERELSMQEAIQQQTLKKALDGDQTARRDVMKWIEKRNKERVKRGERELRTGELQLEGLDPDNAEEALKLLGVITREQSREREGDGVEHYLIETWAAQMGLSRRRGGEPLGENDIALIKCEVRDQQSLRWPGSLSDDE